MAKIYKLNSETLQVEAYKRPLSRSIFIWLGSLVLSVGLFLFYSYIYIDVLGLEAPRAKFLRARNAELLSKLETLNKQFDVYEKELEELELRDNLVYRSIFGMEEIHSDVRDAGFGGVDRYASVQLRDNSGLLTTTLKRLDMLQKKAYIQSKSLDEVMLLSTRSEEMAMSVPSICPVTPDWDRMYISSGFGNRLDPITRSGYTMHYGIDISGAKDGEPIYSTGNGVVEKVAFDFSGYGHYVIINHGFGYKTRYAHLSEVSVREGHEISRGEKLGGMGNTGKRSTGTHLHYEVIYRNKVVNPINYFNSKVSPETYALMIQGGQGDEETKV